MPIPKPFIKFIEAAKVKYELVSHRRVFTAHDKAATLHVDPKMVVKATVFNVGAKEHALVLVSAGKHIDVKKVKVSVNTWLKKQSKKPENKIDFAKEAWMKRNMPGDVGMTPVSPGFLHMPAFVDNALLKQPKLYVNAASYENSILVNQANFIKLLGSEFAKGPFAVTPKKK